MLGIDKVTGSCFCRRNERPCVCVRVGGFDNKMRKNYSATRAREPLVRTQNGNREGRARRESGATPAKAFKCRGSRAGLCCEGAEEGRGGGGGGVEPPEHTCLVALSSVGGGKGSLYYTEGATIFAIGFADGFHVRREGAVVGCCCVHLCYRQASRAYVLVDDPNATFTSTRHYKYPVAMSSRVLFYITSNQLEYLYSHHLCCTRPPQPPQCFFPFYTQTHTHTHTHT